MKQLLDKLDAIFTGPDGLPAFTGSDADRQAYADTMQKLRAAVRSDDEPPLTEKQCFILEHAMELGAVIIDDDATIYAMTDRRLVELVETRTKPCSCPKRKIIEAIPTPPGMRAITHSTETEIGSVFTTNTVTIRQGIFLDEFKGKIYDIFHNMTVPSAADKTMGYWKEYAENLLVPYLIDAFKMPKTDREHHVRAKSVEEEYELFWKGIVAPNGELDLELVKLELYDFSFLLEELPKIYEHITGGKMSKTTYYARDVIQETEDHYEEYFTNPDGIGTAEQAIDFALNKIDDHYDRAEFLESYQHGDISDWPEYADFIGMSERNKELRGIGKNDTDAPKEEPA